MARGDMVISNNSIDIYTLIHHDYEDGNILALPNSSNSFSTAASVTLTVRSSVVSFKNVARPKNLTLSPS